MIKEPPPEQENMAAVEEILNEERSTNGLLPAHKLLEHLARIPSITGREKKATAWLAQQLRKGDFDDVYVDEVNNVICSKGDGERSILAVGGVDTYRGHIPVRIEHENLYGRGVTQSKGPLVAALSALHQLPRDELKDKNVTVVACTNTLEFGDSGAYHILDKFAPDYLINLEPTQWEHTAHSYKGMFGFYYYQAQPNAHYTAIDQRTSSQAFEFVNTVLQYLTDEYPNRLSPHIDDRIATPQIEIHYFNTETDGLTEQTAMKMGVRYPVDFDIDTYQKFIMEKKQDATIEVWGDIPACHVPEDTELSKLFHSVISQEGGKPLSKKMTTTSIFSTYARSWPDIPMISYGPGNHELDRTPDEHIHLDDVSRSVGILKEVFKHL